jgi:hypothetical protein
MTTITWDHALLEKFRRAYTRAVKAGHGEFTFQDNVVLVGYAKYLIEYLDKRLNE